MSTWNVYVNDQHVGTVLAVDMHEAVQRAYEKFALGEGVNVIISEQLRGVE